MLSSKQTHMFDYFICYHPESGFHVTRPNQGLSLGRGKSRPRNEVGIVADLGGKNTPYV